MANTRLLLIFAYAFALIFLRFGIGGPYFRMQAGFVPIQINALQDRCLVLIHLRHFIKR